MLLAVIVWLVAGSAGSAQAFKEYRARPFNWGAKVGFNSAVPVISRFTIEGNEVENREIEYKVGLLASVFCRVNVDRFFIQPAVEWTSSQYDLSFSFPPGNDLSGMDGEALPASEHRRMKMRSFGVPVLIGYYLIKEGPYGLSLMAGPKVKYDYKNDFLSYTVAGKRTYTSDNNPWNVGIVTGVGVSIGRLFFDFTYEFGLGRVESAFLEKAASEPLLQQVRIDKRIDRMSFSLGFLF